MSLLDLATPKMVAISFAWLDNERERPLIHGLSLAGPLLAKIENAHKGLVDFQNAGKGELPEVRELITTTTALDADHDRFARGIHSVTSGLVDFSGPQIANGYRALRAALFPTGLDINKQSYLVQAGEPVLREGRLSDDDKLLLEATLVTTPEGTVSLRALLDHLTATAQALGEAEARKIRLKQESASPSSRGPARKAWARIVAHFLATIELEEALSPQDRRRILEPLENALVKAAQARARAKKKGVAFDPEAEVVGED